MIKNFNKQLILYILSGIVLCIFVTLPYFKQGFFPTHDGEWAVVRAAEMFREIRDLQFPPRYSGALNFGYGYPLFNFAYPFPYYLTTLFHTVNIGFVNSVKAVFVVSVFLSFFGMFFLSAYFWKSRLAGFLSAALYLFLPYRMVDLYVRGSIGESVAFSLYPLILLSMLFILDIKRRNIGILGTALLIGILALTHNISAVYFGIITLFFILALVFSQKYKESLYIILSVLWGGIISSFFIIPALYERQNIKLSKIPIADRDLYYVTLSKIFFPSWGYGTPTESNSFTYSLGIPQIVGFIISLASIQKTKDYIKSIFVSFSLLSAIFILLMFPFSHFMWSLPLLSEINYPWTLLLPLGFLMSFLSGAVVKIKYRIFIGTALVLSALLITFSYARPLSYIDRGDEYYITNEATTTSSQELMPVWVHSMPSTRYENKVELDGQINSLAYSSNNIMFEAISTSSSLLTVNQIYYPGWRAFVNNQEVEVFYNNPTGVMKFTVPQGNSSVKLHFSETKLRGFFDIISLGSIVLLFGFALSIIGRYFILQPKKLRNKK